MRKKQTRRHFTNPALWLALAAAGPIAACQGEQQTQAETTAAAAPAAGASAVHAAPPAEPPHATVEETMEIGYVCEGDKTFTIAFAGDDELLVTIDGEAHTLGRRTGHEGMLFANDDIIFKGQGREASVQVGGVPTFIDCEAQGHGSGR